MSEKTPAPVGAAVALDLDAIEARFAQATADEVIYELWPALVAEVRRLTESRATVAANLSASLMLAEAEVVTLRAKVAALQVAVSHSAESCADGPCEFHETVARAESAEAKVAAVEAEKEAILGQVDQAARLLRLNGKQADAQTVIAQVRRWPEFVDRAALATGEGE